MIYVCMYYMYRLIVGYSYREGGVWRIQIKRTIGNQPNNPGLVSGGVQARL